MSATRVAAEQHLPLSPVVLHTLLSLVDGELHGYAIAQQVESRTGGRMRMGPGTLYGCLHRLAASGWVEECEPPEAATEASRRRYYRLTVLGREILEAEGARLASDVRHLLEKRVLRGDG